MGPEKLLTGPTHSIHRFCSILGVGNRKRDDQIHRSVFRDFSSGFSRYIFRFFCREFYEARVSEVIVRRPLNEFKSTNENRLQATAICHFFFRQALPPPPAP